MTNKFFPEIKGRFAFGCMRLLMNGKEVDVGQFCEMVDIFLNSGFNYIPSECIKCGACAEQYPQHLDIPSLLGKVSKELE